MMKANRDICCYCGGCVGVCPFDALELEETVLTFNDKCTQCGLCAKFCPVGAIKKLPPKGGKG
jgi:ferredoxin